MGGLGVVTVLVPGTLQGRVGSSLYGSVASPPLEDVNDEGRKGLVIVVTSSQPNGADLIGSITRAPSRGTHPKAVGVWVELGCCTHQDTREIYLNSLRVAGENISLSRTNLIIYDAEEIKASELVGQKYLFEEDGDYVNNLVPYFVHVVQNDTKHIPSSWLATKFILVLLLITKIILIITWLPKMFIEKLNIILERKIGYTSNSLKQILLRIKQYEMLEKELKLNERILVSGRIVTLILVDVMLGSAVVWLITSHASLDDVYATFSRSTKVVAARVHQLLEWLRGAPAGLKLNQPLTQALATFFSYHVHLWRLYLELAEPVLRSLAWVFLWVGTCGVSIQVAILSDLLDLAALHLYCFYVYATRMHMVQVSLLGSQWRAFRGRKWNPLKRRIDTFDPPGAHTSLTRVLNAVIFTLVIFLLPTTTIYYLVFVSLRLSLNLIQGVQALVVWLLNVNPLFLVLLTAMDSQRVKGDIYFSRSVSGQQVLSPVVVQLHTCPTPLAEVLRHTHTHVFPKHPAPHWKTILRSLVYGVELL